MASKENQMTIAGNCCFPTAEHPFYHIRLTFSLNEGERYQIKQVQVNGVRVREFEPFHNSRFLKDQMLEGGGLSELVLRWNWKAGEEAAVEVTGEAEQGKKSLVLKARVPTSTYGGYWDPAWKYYASFVCTELAGIDRFDEPVHASMALYSDRIQDPEKELRIVAVDPVSGAHREVPCQVHEVRHFKAEGLTIGEEYQPTTTFQLAFFADVPAYSSRVYLAFYGNPKAKAPIYAESLSASGEGVGLTIDNRYYTALLHPKSGAIDEIHMKMGVNAKFFHHVETNGALQWNPCFYAPPRPWLHASDWDPPPNHSVLKGPVFISTVRSGHVEPYRDESYMAVTYRFYSRTPWIWYSTKLEVRQDIAAKALRNGEIVLRRKLVDEFAWRNMDGTVGCMTITDGPRHPKTAKVLPAETPWVCFFNRKGRYGLGIITSKLTDFRADGGLPKLFNRYCYLQWSKWVYFSRPLVYTFLTSGKAPPNSARLVPVTAGNIYYEEMALLPVVINPEREDFEAIELSHAKLTNPLSVMIVEDTDPRAPEGWVQPVLVQDFDEFADD